MKPNSISKCLMAITGAYGLDGGIAAVNRMVIRSIIEEKYQLDIFSLCENKDELLSHIPAYFHTLGGLKEPRGVQRGTASSPLRSSLHVNVN